MLFVLLVVAFLVLCVVCAFKESKITGLYKSIGVFGRLKAYLAMDLFFAGLFLTIVSIICLINPESDLSQITGGNSGMTLLLGIVCFAIGALVYYLTLRKCPDFLKKRCILDMLIVGMGVAMKICVFFIGAVWEMVKPDEYIDSNGTTVYVMKNGDVYNPATDKMGTLTTADDGSTVVVYPN